MVEEIENWNRVVILKVADEALPASHELDTHMEELAVKRYAPSGSTVMREDQICECANTMKKADMESDVARRSEQRVVLLKATLAVHDSEIFNFQGLMWKVSPVESLV